MSSDQDVVVKWEKPSLCPRSGSSITNKIIRTANIPSNGVTRNPQCQEPKILAVSDPII